MSTRPRATVYIPCHNYGRFVEVAIRSVLNQSFQEWELIVVDDGSTDDSWAVIERFRSDDRIQAHRNETPRGLRRVANECIQVARGEFILRLDADDMLHPRCLELLVEAAATAPHSDLTFSDFYYMDDLNEVTGVEILPTSPSGEYEAHTFPPHGASSLIRRDALLRIGKLSETLIRQDGHEIWIKLIASGARVRHVALPLFFYRKHGPSQSSDLHAVLEDRARLKRDLASRIENPEPVTAVIPVKNTYPEMPDLPFRRYRGERLIDIVIRATLEVPQIARIVVTTDSHDVATYCADLQGPIEVIERQEQLKREPVTMREILRDAAKKTTLSDETVICWLNVNCPRRRSHHIQKALDNFFLYSPDSVVSVYEEQNLMFQMGQAGLRLLNPSGAYSFRREREVIYVDAGAVRVFRAKNLRSSSYLGDRIGHALMAREDAMQIRGPDDLLLLDPYESAETILEA